MSRSFISILSESKIVLCAWFVPVLVIHKKEIKRYFPSR